jgi:asparagine synthase (glutamine-hydrolysing)
MEFSGNLTSNPCFQDAPAILYLKNQNIINSEDIIVAGHSGDMLGGSHIPISLLKEISFSSSGITNILLKCKYHLNALSDYSGIIEKNNDYFDKFDISNIDSFLDIYDLLWNIKYRQSNFIVNSVRVYDFWGFDWRLPLWDDEYAILWCSIKWDYKFNSYIYNKFMFQTYFYPMNVDYIKEIKPSFFKKHTSVFIKDFLKKIVFFRRKNNENYFAPVINLLDTNNYKHKYGLKKVNLKNVDSLIACRYITHIEKIIKHEVSD